MAKCAYCQTTILWGKVEDAGVAYCTPACQSKANFLVNFRESLSRVQAENPDPFPNPAPKPQDPIEEELAPSAPAHHGRDLMVILLGMGTSLAVAILINFIIGLVEYPFHAQTIWFVIPIGALLCGMVAGSGFWAALRWFDRLPTIWTYLAAGFVGALSYVFIYFLMWWMLEVNGVKARDAVGFFDFLQYVIEHQRIKIGHGNAPGAEVGSWGYPRFALNVVGFMVGVMAMVSIGGGKAYCRKCNRYLKTVGKQVRSWSDPEETATVLHPVIVGLVTGRVQEALDIHAPSGEAEDKQFFTTTIMVEACPDCAMHLATLTASLTIRKEVKQIDGFTFQGKTDHMVQLSS